MELNFIQMIFFFFFSLSVCGIKLFTTTACKTTRRLQPLHLCGCYSTTNIISSNMFFFNQFMTLKIVLSQFFFYSRLANWRAGFSVWDELIWDQPGPNKQIKWKQITSVWLDVWRDQCISGHEEIEKSLRISLKKVTMPFLCQKPSVPNVILSLESFFRY